MTSSQWRSNSTLTDFKSFAGYWRKQQGHFQSINRSGTNWYSGTGGWRFTLAYEVAGALRDGNVTVVVVSQGKSLAIQSCNFTPSGPPHAPRAG